MNWFETWFDTPLYEELYSHRDDREAELLARLISGHFPSTDYPQVLDLACGRGRHSYNLASLGYRVTGIDLSENAIRKAKNKAPEVLKNPPVFQVHDMRRPFPGTYNLIVNLFTSFGYFEDDRENQRVIDHIATALKPNGALVIDFLNPEWVTSNLVQAESKLIGGYTVDIERFIEKNMVQKKMTFIKNGTAESQTFHEKVKLYDLNWFEAELERSGIRIRDIYGDYIGAKFSPPVSPRMIIFAEKKTSRAYVWDSGFAETDKLKGVDSSLGRDQVF